MTDIEQSLKNYGNHTRAPVATVNRVRNRLRRTLTARAAATSELTHLPPTDGRAVDRLRRRLRQPKKGQSKTADWAGWAVFGAGIVAATVTVFVVSSKGPPPPDVERPAPAVAQIPREKPAEVLSPKSETPRKPAEPRRHKNAEEPRLALVDVHVEGAIDAEAINASLERVASAFTACRGSAFNAPEVSITLALDRFGRLDALSTNANADSEVVGCVEAEIAKLRFPMKAGIAAGRTAFDARGVVRFRIERQR